MTDTSKEALRLLNERMCAKINDGGTIFAENVADMLLAIRDLAAERDALAAENAKLKDALGKYVNWADTASQVLEEIYDENHPDTDDVKSLIDRYEAGLTHQALKETSDDLQQST